MRFGFRISFWLAAQSGRHICRPYRPWAIRASESPLTTVYESGIGGWGGLGLGGLGVGFPGIGLGGLGFGGLGVGGEFFLSPLASIGAEIIGEYQHSHSDGGSVTAKGSDLRMTGRVSGRLYFGP